MAFKFKSRHIVLFCVTLGWAGFSAGQTAPQTPVPDPAVGSAGSAQDSAPRSRGSISGTVVDQSGAVVLGARVKLTLDQASHDQSHDQAVDKETLSGVDGQFSFADIPPGVFHLTVAAEGFAPQTFSGTVHSGESVTVPQISLEVAEAITDVHVGLTHAEVVELADAQIRMEEKQRVLAVIPNFYVSYIPDAAPLTPKQKFRLALRTIVDPFTFVIVGGTAGIQQGQNHFAAYGQGAEGYGKRFGATYADMVAGTFIGGAILPSLLKQDPRYFYKGTGSVPSRFWYAIGNAVICKGDNKRWQVNYSNILGNLAAGGISNLYYPEQDRNGAGLTLENGAIGIGAAAIGNLFQEFIVRKLTPKKALQGSGQ